MGEAIPDFNYIKFYHRANNRAKYAGEFYNPMIDDKDGHIPSPLIMCICTSLHHALLEWQKHNGIHLKASKSKLKADRPDRSNYSNYKNDGVQIASSCAARGRNLLTLPGVANPSTFLMNTWNTLPECYQQRVYKNTLATVKRRFKQAEIPTPAAVNSTEAARGDIAILVDNLTSEVPLEEPEMVSSGPNTPIDINCANDELHVGIPRRCKDYDDDGDEIDDCDAIPTGSRQRGAGTDLVRFALGTSEVDGYVADDSDDADADDEKEALLADDRTTQTLED